MKSLKSHTQWAGQRPGSTCFGVLCFVLVCVLCVCVPDRALVQQLQNPQNGFWFLRNMRFYSKVLGRGSPCEDRFAELGPTSIQPRFKKESLLECGLRLAPVCVRQVRVTGPHSPRDLWAASQRKNRIHNAFVQSRSNRLKSTLPV